MNTRVISQRLQHQKLSAPGFEKPAEVVRWMGAVQAQDFNAAKWALALRMRHATNDSVEQAFNKGEIIRTHLLRPTWHFVRPEDIRWLLQLTAPRVNQRAGPNYRKLELDVDVFKRSHKALTKALRDGKHLARSALRTVLNNAGIDARDPIRLAHILIRAELDAVVCSGPRIGKQFTYALLDERAPATKAMTRDEALAELTRRYFQSHGPATLPDFVWWSGLTVADARLGIELTGKFLEQTSVQDKIYWSAASAKTVPPVHSTHLLPAFDEYFVAYKDRQMGFEAKDGLTTLSVLGPTVIVNGIAAGTWKRTDAKNAVNIAFNALRALGTKEKLAVAKAADRYAAFLDVPATFV